MEKRLSAALAAAITVCAGTTALANTHEPAPPRHVQASDMADAANPSNLLNGAGILARDSNGVSATLSTSGLSPNGAYSVWWVVFNRPGRCTAPCSIDDVNAGVGQVFYATGFIAGADGVATTAARLERGPIPIGADRLSLNNPAVNPAGEVGLKNPFRAEIHVVVRTHGPLIIGRADEQLGSFNGACEVFSLCANKQVVVFAPVK